MGIIGLTDRGAQFPRIGTLRKGDEKKDEKRPGADLTYFRFDSDDADAAAVFQAAYGPEPRHINVYLPYQTTGENFAAWQEAWSASSLQHRCDGQTMTRWRTPDGSYSTEPTPCMGGCKPVGRLMVIVPELRRFAYVTVQTTSIHDIMELQANLEAVEMLRGDLRGIPFVLSRRPREISTPRANGQRARTTKWLLAIEAAPTWVGHQLVAMQRAALPDGALLALPDGGQVDTLSGEILDTEPETTDVQPDVTAPAKVPSRASVLKRIRTLINQAIQQEIDLGDLLDFDAEAMAIEDLVAHGQAIRAAIEAAPDVQPA